MPEMKQQIDAVAQVYAASLFELADELGGTEQIASIHQELGELVELADDQPEFGAFLHSRIIRAAEKQESLRKMFGNGRISDLLLRYLLVLNDKERLDHLALIHAAFTQLYWDRIGRVEAEVYSAEAMDEGHLSRIRERIKAVLGQDPILRNHVDPSMIGGLKLQLGDKLIDASVATRLRQIRESLSQSGSETIRSRFSSLLGE